MKNMKKLASLLLALVMVFSLATTAFAADGDTTYQYEIYQIFTGDYANGTLSNIKWGENGTGTKGTAVGDDTLTALAEVNTSAATDAEKLAVIEKYADLTKNPVKTTDASTSANISVSDLADGYYLVKDVAKTQEGENQAYTTYVVQVVDGTLTITRKADVPEVEKKIVLSETNKVDANEASIGDTVNYEFTGDMPTNIADYDTYYYVFTDTLSKGLTLTDPDGAATNDIKVTVNGVDVTKYFYINATTYSENAGTTITIGMQDLLALELIADIDTATDGNQTVGDITASTTVVVTYSATLNEHAVIGSTGNTNDVKLEYSNNPNDDGEGATTPPTTPTEPEPDTPTGVTPNDEVVTYTTDLIIKKTDESGEILPGAAFKIEGEGVNIVVTTGEYFVEATNGTYYKLKNGSYTTTAPTTDNPSTDDVNEDNTDAYENTTTTYKMDTQVTLDTTGTGAVTAEAYVDSITGELTFTGLGAGTYTITETVTPAGYNSIAPFKVTITWDATNGFTYTGTDFDDANENGEQDDGELNINEVTVVNKAGSTLPTTGGMGTTLFYVFGGILVAAAVVLLVTKKRMSTAE